MSRGDQLARRIREALEVAGVSQAALARHVGVSRQLVNLWVTDDPTKRLEPSEEHLRLIASRCGTTVEWLRGTSQAGPSVRVTSSKPSQHRHGSGDVWRRRLEEALAKAGTARPATVQIPGCDLSWDVIAVNNDAAVMLAAKRVDPSALRELLWELLLLRQADKALGVNRCYAVAAAMSPEDARPLAKEAAMQGLTLVANLDGAAAAEELLRLRSSCNAAA